MEMIPQNEIFAARGRGDAARPLARLCRHHTSAS